MPALRTYMITKAAVVYHSGYIGDRSTHLTQPHERLNPNSQMEGISGEAFRLTSPV